MRGGAVAGFLMLVGGCVERNPMFIESTGTGATTDEATTTDSGVDSTGEPTGTDATMTGMTGMTGMEGKCGDGVVNPDEECDDGDDDPLNGCDNECTLPSCGDGTVQTVEVCDDGNFDDNDGCLDTCLPAKCGDGKVYLGKEGCDDGNDVDDDACSNACVLASCGDGAIQAEEACDDGNDDNTDACLNDCIVAKCGDGVLKVDVEECDDGNADADDACVDCKIPALPFRLIFVSSVSYDGKMGGLAGADLACQTLASAAMLPGKYLAWLGDQAAWPANRMTKADVPYIRTDFTMVAKHWTDLTDGTLIAPIDKTEAAVHAVMGPGPCNGGPTVHTNLGADGKLFDAEYNCDDWKSAVGTVRAGQLGPPGLMNGLWTSACSIGCSVKAPIYCIQQ
jgi:cysteine-rich repeat protein